MKDFIGDDNINWSLFAREEFNRGQLVPRYGTTGFEYFKHLMENVPEKFTVVDLGCNIGKYYYDWKAMGCGFYHGVDGSEEAIKIAMREIPKENTYFWNQKLEKVDELFGENIFDIAFTNTVLQHTCVEAKHEILDAVGKILKPGGLFIIQEKNDVETRTTFTRNGWIKIFKEHGFNVLLVQGKQDNPPNGFVFQNGK